MIRPEFNNTPTTRIFNPIKHWFLKKYQGQSFDIAWRYQPVLVLLNKEKKNIRILDAGSGTRGLAAYTNRPVFGVDTDVQKEKSTNLNLTAASLTNLPYADKSFHFTASVDVLEHIPDEFRLNVVRELMRVTSGCLILSAPSGKNSESADKEYMNAFEQAGQEPGNFLKEHICNGLPANDEMVEWVKNAGISLNRIFRLYIGKNATTRIWLALRKARLSRNPIWRGLDLWLLPFSPAIFKFLNFGVCYREVVVVTFNEDREYSG